MVKLKTTLISVIAIIMSAFTLIGFAQVTTSLQITGSAQVEKLNQIYISYAYPSSSYATVINYSGTALSSQVNLCVVKKQEKSAKID